MKKPEVIRDEWKVDWPSAVLGAFLGAVLTWVATTSWIATELAR